MGTEDTLLSSEERATGTCLKHLNPVHIVTSCFLLHHHHHMALHPNSGPGLPSWCFVTITFLQGWIASPVPNPKPGRPGIRIYDPRRQGRPGTGYPFYSPFTTCMDYSGTICFFHIHLNSLFPTTPNVPSVFFPFKFNPLTKIIYFSPFQECKMPHVARSLWFHRPLICGEEYKSQSLCYIFSVLL
jgi:hypothetical protein